jgi:transcriptional regulator with XRE-family HTH domain
MQETGELLTIRDRLTELIRGKYGKVAKATVRAVCKEAGVHYTTLARYLLVEENRTESLRPSTLRALANALDANLGWILDGKGHIQGSLWPILHRDSAESEVPDPHAQVLAVMEQLRDIPDLPESVRLRAYRAAVSAVIDVVSAERRTIGHNAYRCLMRLDALRREPDAAVAS